MLYDRPVHELFRDAAKQLPSPTTPNDIINWFAREYPLVKKTTVIAHIKGLTVNDRNRATTPSADMSRSLPGRQKGSWTCTTLIRTSMTRT